MSANDSPSCSSSCSPNTAKRPPLEPNSIFIFPAKKWRKSSEPPRSQLSGSSANSNRINSSASAVEKLPCATFPAWLKPPILRIDDLYKQRTQKHRGNITIGSMFHDHVSLYLHAISL